VTSSDGIPASRQAAMTAAARSRTAMCKLRSSRSSLIAVGSILSLGPGTTAPAAYLPGYDQLAVAAGRVRRRRRAGAERVA
jgi:hypothetical protein